MFDEQALTFDQKSRCNLGPVVHTDMRADAITANSAPPPLHARPAERLVPVTIAAFWLLYLIVNTLRMALSAPWAEQLDMLPRRAVVSSAGVGLTFLFHRLIRPLDSAPLWPRVQAVAAGALLFAVFYAAFNDLVFYHVRPTAYTLAELTHMGQPIAPWKLVASTAVNWYFFFAACGALYLAVGYAQRTQAAERAALEAVAAARSAQLRALRYQINPHFLFNALNSLSALVLRARPDEAERMILNLSTFFRMTLSTDPVEDVPLAEEIRLQRLCLDIEAVRFPERLRMMFDIPAELEEACVPALILQPLVENAIKHGVAHSKTPVTLTIRARTSGGGLLLLVENDGPLAAAGCERVGSVGLANVRARLVARFGSAAEFSAGPRDTGGWRAAIRLPIMHRDC